MSKKNVFCSTEHVENFSLNELMDDSIFEYLPKLEDRLNKTLMIGTKTDYLLDAQKQFKLLQKTVLVCLKCFPNQTNIISGTF